MPVDVASGAVFTAARDFGFPGLLRLDWRRSYSSESAEDGWLGRGWASPYFMSLRRYSDGYALVDESGGTTRFAAPARLAVGGRVPHYAANMELIRESDGYAVEHWHHGSVDVERFVFPNRSEGAMRLRHIEDWTGARVGVEYDSRGRPILVRQETENRAVRIAYTPSDRIASIHFASAGGGDRTLATYRYDSEGRLVEARDALGQATQYRYDADHRLTGETNPLGSTFHFGYDGRGRCTFATGDGGYYERTLEYLSAPAGTLVTDSQGDATRYYTTPAGQVLQQVSPLGAVTTHEYDELGRSVKVVHPDGGIESSEYDDRGNRVCEIDQLGGRTATRFDARHLPVSITLPGGAEYGFRYDDRGRLIEKTAPLGLVWAYARDERGLLTAATDADGSAYSIRHGAHLEWVETSDRDGFRNRFEYDEAGNLTTVVFPDRSAHRFRHDARGRVVAMVDEAGAETRYEWNAVGGPTARTAPGSPPERWTYDRVGRAVSHIDRLGNRLALEYDTEGSLTALVNRVGERATFEYNADGRRIRETGFDARATSYGFDAVGRCTRIDRPGGRSLEARYNLCGEVIWRRPSDGAPETFAYDPDGLLVGAANARAAVELERDALGRIVAEVQPGGRVEYEFAGLTRMVARRLPGQPGPAAEVRLTYDARGRVAGIADAAGPFQSLLYDAGGRMVERRTPAGFAERCAYDSAGRWQSQEMGSRSRDYEFDARRNLVRTGEGAGTALRYDALDRLVGVGGAADPEAYRYDANGAIADSHRGVRDIGPGGRVVAAGPDAYEYDADGCVRRVTGPAGAMDLEYDFDGNLIRAESPGRRSEYAFDALGRRVAKVVDGRRTDFLWSGTMLAAALPEGEPGEYFLAFDFEPVARWSGERRLVPTADPTGTVRELWDEIGGLVWEGGSEAYGSPKGAAGGPGRTGLRGQYVDAETGFHHHLHRSYDPRIGDFLSPDPIGFEGGVNLYAYPRNPICWDDPLGLDCGGRSPKCTNPNNTVSPRAARRQAAAGAGVPRTQQPAGQRSVKGRVDGKETPAGRQYDYDTPTPGGGAPGRVSVQHSLSDNVPGHGPHWEAGPPKPGGQTDSVGRPRLQNNKVKVDEVPEPNS